MESPNKKEDTVVVYNAKMARFLLHMNYTMVDLRQDKYNLSRTVYIFKRENNIEQYLFTKNKNGTRKTTWQNEKEYPTRLEPATNNGNQMN